MTDWDWDDPLYNLITGHAGARFKYLDVRSTDAWNAERLAYESSTTHIPLDELERRVRQTFDLDADLVVFGADAWETAKAYEILRRLGYKSVLQVDEGFSWWERRNLDIAKGPGGE